MPFLLIGEWLGHDLAPPLGILRPAQGADTTPASLQFDTQPSNANAYAAISPSITVKVLNASGELLTGDNSTQVTLSFNTNPPTGALSGTLTKIVVGGVATFDNISIDRYASGYKLAAAATGLTGAVSNAFNIAQVTWVSDTFTEAANTPIASHAPDTNVYGHPWAQSKSNGGSQSGTPVTVEASTGHWRSSVDFYGSVIDVEHSDYEIQVTYRTQSGDNERYGIIVRWASDGNDHEIQYRSDFSDIRLYPVTGGSQGTSQLIASYNFAVNTTYTLKVVVYGTSCKVYLDGNLMGEGTLSLNPTSTKVGILRRADLGGVDWLDNFSVKSA